MRKFIVWLLTALGLMKRQAPPPAPPTPPPPAPPTPAQRPAPLFHGFWMRHGDFVYEREMTILQVGPSVSGCPPTETRFGYEDNGSGPYQWKMTVREAESGKANDIYSRRGNKITGEWSSDRYAVYFPLWSGESPPYPFTAPNSAQACPPRPPAPTIDPPQNTTPIVVRLWIQNADGAESQWKMNFQAAKAGCE